MTKIKKRPMCGKLVFLLPFVFCAASLSADDAVLSGGETEFQLDGTVHVFRESGRIAVTRAGEVEILLVGGGGRGGQGKGGGGGAGGNAWNYKSGGAGGSGIVVIRYRMRPRGMRISIK